MLAKITPKKVLESKLKLMSKRETIKFNHLNRNIIAICFIYVEKFIWNEVVVFGKTENQNL